MTLANRIGILLREVDPLFTKDKPISFDPVQMTVLQNLVRPAVLQAKVTVAKKDFFKAILFLDYFTEVVAGRGTVLDDIGVIVEELDNMADYLDPDLIVLVRYCGLFINSDLNGKRFFRKASIRNLRRRHDLTNAQITWPDSDALDLFHNAVGRLVADQISDPRIRGALEALVGRNDLRAAILADAVLTALPADEVGDAALAALADGDVLTAAVALLEDLATSCAGWSLRDYVQALRARLESA